MPPRIPCGVSGGARTPKASLAGKGQTVPLLRRYEGWNGAASFNKIHFLPLRFCSLVLGPCLPRMASTATGATGATRDSEPLVICTSRLTSTRINAFHRRSATGIVILRRHLLAAPHFKAPEARGLPNTVGASHHPTGSSKVQSSHSGNRLMGTPKACSRPLPIGLQTGGEAN
jgi:hypothetical protein